MKFDRLLRAKMLFGYFESIKTKFLVGDKARSIVEPRIFPSELEARFGQQRQARTGISDTNHTLGSCEDNRRQIENKC